MKIVSNIQMKNIEESIINIGITQELLMENAGIALFYLLKKDDCLSRKKILILAGPGNNGGDSLVLARKLFSNNISVEVVFVAGVDNYRGASRKNLELLIKLGVSQKNYFDIENFSLYLDDFNIIVDGIFGIGLNKETENIINNIISAVNESEKEVVSIDIPSGINGDSGEVMGVAIKATNTLILGRTKVGNLMYPGNSYCGKLYLDKLCIPSTLTKGMDNYLNIPIEYSKRDEDTHKGSFKKVLFVGGAKKYYGAPYLNSVAFLKSGGSYSNLACPENLVGPLVLKASEIVFCPLKETRSGSISIENLKTIMDNSENKDLVVMGGGISTEEESQRLINILVSKISKPLVLDGDGITALKDKLDSLTYRNAPTILTPHLGEMAFVTGKSIEEVKKNSIDIARSFAMKYRVILVLKSARTIIAYPNGKIYINISGNSALSVAGSGDILAGVIAAQFSLGLTIEEAARMGVFIHGLCGDLLEKFMGQDGVMAQDILDYLPKTLKYYRDNFEDIKEKYSVNIL